MSSLINWIISLFNKPAVVSAPTIPVPVVPISPVSALPWMDWMKSHIGESENTGSSATAFDKEVFSHTNYGSLNGIMVAGCAATACAALEETGYKSPHNAAAISFKNYGTACELKPGCIIVFEWSPGEHHVCFCSSIVDADIVACLGGNQSHQVKISNFYKKYILATRWPVK